MQMNPRQKQRQYFLKKAQWSLGLGFVPPSFRAQIFLCDKNKIILMQWYKHGVSWLLALGRSSLLYVVASLLIVVCRRRLCRWLYLSSSFFIKFVVGVVVQALGLSSLPRMGSDPGWGVRRVPTNYYCY